MKLFDRFRRSTSSVPPELRPYYSGGTPWWRRLRIGAVVAGVAVLALIVWGVVQLAGRNSETPPQTTTNGQRSNQPPQQGQKASPPSKKPSSGPAAGTTNNQPVEVPGGETLPNTGG